MDKQLIKYIKAHYQKKFAGRTFVPGKTHIPASGKAFDSREMVAMTEAVLDGWWTEGRFAAAFESELANFLGVEHCITTNSGSSANLLAVSALTSLHLGKRRLRPHDEVITVAAGFPTTINPLILYRLIPVFIDIDLKTLNIDVNKLEHAVSPRTKAVFLPHNLGNPFNVEAVKKICRKHNLWLIEDCCDALGSKYQNRYVGAFGDLATLSFYAAHHITTGEGGAVVTSNAKLASIVRSFRDWGREYWFRTGEDVKRDHGLGSHRRGELPADYDTKFIFSEIGFNLRLTDMQAALGLIQLSKLPKFIKHRKNAYAFLLKELEPFKKFLIFQEPEKYGDPAWFGFLLTVKTESPFKRQDLVACLNSHNIGTRMFMAGNLTKQPYMRAYRVKFKSGDLSNTDYVLKNSVWIGVHQGIDQPRLSYMVKVLKTFLSRF